MDKGIPLYFNKPQLFSQLIIPKEETAIWGRGTGKSQGLIAPRTQHWLHVMKRSTGASVGATYQQLLTRTLPPVIAGWERMGYKRDKHFFIGRKPPKSWKWDEPYVAPLSYDYFIPWYNGSGFHLVSQDRPGSSNGLNIDWWFADEGKLLNRQKLEEELYQTNRGNGEYFGHLPEHHGFLICSDMPTSAGGKWLLDKREEMDESQINLILAVQGEILKLRTEFFESSKTRQRAILSQIARYEREWVELRRNSIYYSEFSSLENIHALGPDFIKQQKRILPDIVFRASILGERIMKVEDGFYGQFDQDIHGYDAFDYSYLDSLDYDFNKLSDVDCRMDADLNKNHPLDIAFDYGGSINVCVTGQPWDFDVTGSEREFRYQNALFVKNPERIQELCVKWCKYYKHYPTKDVYYYYDHTAIGEDAGRDKPLYEIVIEILSAHGWNVTPVYIGQAPRHSAKHMLWSIALKGDDPRIPKPSFNRTNCKYLIISIEQAELIQGKTGFEKNKKPEKNKALPQEETTHFSDAGDTLFYGKYSERLKEMPEFADNMYQ